MEDELCGGVAGCGHPKKEHSRVAGDSRTACAHQLSKGGRSITCSCRRFKAVRSSSSISGRAVTTAHG
jgi:hypothetical protein